MGGGEVGMMRGILQQHPPDGEMNQAVAWMVPSSGGRDGRLGGGQQDGNKEIMVMEESAREYDKLLLFGAHSCFVITRVHFP